MKLGTVYPVFQWESHISFPLSPSTAIEQEKSESWSPSHHALYTPSSRIALFSVTSFSCITL